MAAIEFNWKPTDRQLQQFGAVSLFALPLIGFMLTGRPLRADWQPFHTVVIGGAALVGLLLATAGWFQPPAIRPVFVLACLAAFPIGLVIGELILFIMFVLIFTPVALFFRIVGRNALERRIDEKHPATGKRGPLSRDFAATSVNRERAKETS